MSGVLRRKTQWGLRPEIFITEITYRNFLLVSYKVSFLDYFSLCNTSHLILL